MGEQLEQRMGWRVVAGAFGLAIGFGGTQLAVPPQDSSPERLPSLARCKTSTAALPMVLLPSMRRSDPGQSVGNGVHSRAIVHMWHAAGKMLQAIMAPGRFVRMLVLLTMLAVGIGSTTAAFACATIAAPIAMSEMPANRCGEHDRGSSNDVAKGGVCALACPAGCLMAMPTSVAEASIHRDTKFNAIGNLHRLTGKEFGPEPPRPRTASAS